MNGKRAGTFYRADSHEIEAWLRSPKSPLYGAKQTVVTEQPCPRPGAAGSSTSAASTASAAPPSSTFLP